MRPVHVLDSHTAGESTRLVLSGLPDWACRTPKEWCERLRTPEGVRWCRSVLAEPRGNEAIVGAFLCDSTTSDHGVVYFNNVGPLGMCGHATIGVVHCLAHADPLLPRLEGNSVSLETQVGVVVAERRPDGTISFENVASYRKTALDLSDKFSEFTKPVEIAFGGNWFALAEVSLRLDSASIPTLLAFSARVREAVRALGETQVDHVELTCKAHDPANSGRNFVLCPGLEWDRSPCGTGTSAKVACLAHHGLLAEGETWRQEGVLGTVFEASYRRDGEAVIPRISGRAWVTARSELRFEEGDIFADGLPAI
jgi:proline racemase